MNAPIRTAEDIECDIRIAVWNTCCLQGTPQEVAQSFIRHLFDDEPCMKRALDTLATRITKPDRETIARAIALIESAEKHLYGQREKAECNMRSAKHLLAAIGGDTLANKDAP